MTGPDDRIAVVIATRNRLDALRSTLRRLNTLPERPPIIVADNGSMDGTPDAVRVEFPNVEVLSLVENRGAEARNLAAQKVTAPFIAFADDDSWWAPGSLGRAADLLSAQPSLGLVAARVLVGPENRLDPTCNEMAASPLPRREGLPGPSILGFLACGAVVRRSAFLGVGGFPNRFGIGGEEELLAIDLAAAGWDLCYVDSLVAHHHPSPLRNPSARRRIQVRNALWSAWMRRPAGGALRKTATLLRPWFRDPATRQGFLDALQGLVGVWRERRSIPAELERALRRLEA